MKKTYISLFLAWILILLSMYSCFAQVSGIWSRVTASGTNTYIAPAPTGCTCTTPVDGSRFQVLFTNANSSTAPTIAIGSLIARTIYNSAGQALSASEIQATDEKILVYSTALTGYRIIGGGGSGGGAGTVTSVALSGGTTGLTVSGSPVTTSGTITLSGGTLAVANGGTGTATPSIVAGTNVTVTGTWPNQTVNSIAGGSGTVTSVSVTTANGVSGSVATATTTPAITLTLGAIVPTTVNGVTLSGSSTPTLAVTGTSTISGTHSGTSSGTNTGDAASVVDAINDGVTTTASSQNALFDALALKQATLVSATNIKTINGVTVLGSGDLTVSGSNLIGPVTSTSGTSSTQYVTPEQFGAVGDGTTNDATALQSCVDASGKYCLLSAKNYRITTGLTIPNGGTIVGAGWNSIISIASGITAITMNANGALINFRIDGTDAASQIGTRVSDVTISGVDTKNRIEGMYYTDLNYGLNAATVYDVNYAGAYVVSNCMFESNNFGVYFEAGAEYNSLTGCQWKGNTTHFRTDATNINIVGGSMTGGTTAIHATIGKLLVTGTHINHNTTAVLTSLSNAVNNTVSFSNASVFGGILNLTASNIRFSSCVFSDSAPATWTLAGGTSKTEFVDCRFLYTPTITLSGNAPTFFGCTWASTMPTTYGGNILEGGLTVGYVAKTGTYTLNGNDYTVEVTSGTHTQTLPTAVGITGRTYVITNSGAGTVTIGTTSSQTFVNVTATPTTLTLTQFQTATVQSNGANWLKISGL